MMQKLVGSPPLGVLLGSTKSCTAKIRPIKIPLRQSPVIRQDDHFLGQAFAWTRVIPPRRCNVEICCKSSLHSPLLTSPSMSSRRTFRRKPLVPTETTYPAHLTGEYLIRLMEKKKDVMVWSERLRSTRRIGRGGHYTADRCFFISHREWLGF